MASILIVGLGGALGAALRYIISLIPLKLSFPVLTLMTNLIGAVFIGFVVGLSSRARLSKGWTLFLKTGVCGGFTTFSTFSLESLALIENGRTLAGGAYMLLSLALCISGVALGRHMALGLSLE